MDEPSKDRCGYTWPEGYEVGKIPEHQSCCFRETLSDTDRCAWHADPDDTDEKTVQTLRDARVDAEIREQTRLFDELLDGAILRGLELGDELCLNRVALRGADLTGADLRQANFTNADIRDADLCGAVVLQADLTETVLARADLTDVSLAESDLTNALLYEADLTEAVLRDANFTDANLGGVDLTDAKLWSTDFIGANLVRVDLTGADLSGADLTDARLEGATLVGTTLFDTDLTRMRPYGARITDTQINYGTDLHTNRPEYASWWQQGPLTPAPRCGYDLDLRKDADGEDSAREKLLGKAADTYNQFEVLAHDNTRPSLESSMFIRRQEMQRKLHRTRGEPFQYAFAVVSGTIFNYGESLARVFLWALFIIVAYAAVYAQFDLIRDSGGGFIDNFVDGIYFSTLTFTTLGLGDFHPDPTSEFARALVTSQAALGAILIAIFVFVLGRRAAR